MDYQKAPAELQYVIDFTSIYQSEKDIYPREAKCLKIQVPHVLVSIAEGNLIAGMMKHGFVGFSPQWGGLYTYYYHEDKVAKALEAIKDKSPQEFVDKINDISAFWHKEKTLNRLSERFHQKFSDVKLGANYEEPGVANADGRVAGTNVDLDKLIRLGLPGLREEIEQYRKSNGNSSFYEALLMTVDTISDACAVYEQQAAKLAETAEGQWQKDLLALSRTLHNIQIQKPATFHEGLQLFWIYAVVSDLMNFGRMDVYLGDLYVQDIADGTLDEEEAIRLLTSLYDHFLTIHKVHDTRVIIGGRGRRNERNADALALVIMETSRRVKDVVPQLTLRYYKGMSQEVYDKALHVNAEGVTFPIIYSDETNIPAVMKAYDVPEEEAERYLPFGCGEYVLEGLSTGTPNNGVNLLKALELTLQNGYDYYHQQQVGIQRNLEELDSFEKLWEAYVQQLQPWVEYVAWHKKFNYDVAAEQAGYLHMSLLMDDCMARGKGLLNGGVRYLNASSEIFGLISTADSLTAIKKLVYEDKVFSLSELAEMLRNNFEGREREQK